MEPNRRRFVQLLLLLLLWLCITYERLDIMLMWKKTTNHFPDHAIHHDMPSYWAPTSISPSHPIIHLYLSSFISIFGVHMSPANVKSNLPSLQRGAWDKNGGILYPVRNLDRKQHTHTHTHWAFHLLKICPISIAFPFAASPAILKLPQL